MATVGQMIRDMLAAYDAAGERLDSVVLNDRELRELMSETQFMHREPSDPNIGRPGYRGMYLGVRIFSEFDQSNRRVFSRAELIQMKAERPHEYVQRQTEILAAYKEGRIV